MIRLYFFWFWCLVNIFVLTKFGLGVIYLGLSFCGVVCDCQLAFGFWWWGTKNAIDGSFHVSMHNFQISFGLSRSMEMSFLIFLFFLRMVVFAILVLGRWLNAFGATLSHCAGRDTSYNANLPTLSSPACGHFCPLYPPPLLPFCGHQSKALRLMKNKFAKILPRAIFSILCIDHWLDVRWLSGS